MRNNHVKVFTGTTFREIRIDETWFDGDLSSQWPWFLYRGLDYKTLIDPCITCDVMTKLSVAILGNRDNRDNRGNNNNNPERILLRFLIPVSELIDSGAADLLQQNVWMRSNRSAKIEFVNLFSTLRQRKGFRKNVTIGIDCCDTAWFSYRGNIQCPKSLADERLFANHIWQSIIINQRPNQYYLIGQRLSKMQDMFREWNSTSLFDVQFETEEEIMDVMRLQTVFISIVLLHNHVAISRKSPSGVVEFFDVIVKSRNPIVKIIIGIKTSIANICHNKYWLDLSICGQLEVEVLSRMHLSKIIQDAIKRSCTRINYQYFDMGSILLQSKNTTAVTIRDKLQAIEYTRPTTDYDGWADITATTISDENSAMIWKNTSGERSFTFDETLRVLTDIMQEYTRCLNYDPHGLFPTDLTVTAYVPRSKLPPELHFDLSQNNIVAGDITIKKVHFEIPFLLLISLFV